VSRPVALFGCLVTVGVLLSPGNGRADDCSFAFYRRCPPDSGVQDGVVGYLKSLCQTPRCPPYCDPTFGFYPTMWRSWPSLYVGDVAAPSSTPSAAPGGTTPPTMPPASDEAKRLPSGVPGKLAPTVRTANDKPLLSGANGR
jgi:hypothetical protein